MRLFVLVLVLLLCACDGVIPQGNGRYTSRATATSDDDIPNQRAQDQAEAFCKAHGQPLVVEGTAGSSRPRPATWEVHFRCGYPASVREPVVIPARDPVPPPTRDLSPAVPDPFPVAQPVGQSSLNPSPPFVPTKRFAVVVSFTSLASGVDPGAEAAFEAQAKALENELQHALKRHVTHWGREGEYNVCLDLTELDGLRRYAFVQALRERFRSGDRTGVREDTECRD